MDNSSALPPLSGFNPTPLTVPLPRVRCRRGLIPRAQETYQIRRASLEHRQWIPWDFRCVVSVCRVPPSLRHPESRLAALPRCEWIRARDLSSIPIRCDHTRPHKPHRSTYLPRSKPRFAEQPASRPSGEARLVRVNYRWECACGAFTENLQEAAVRSRRWFWRRGELYRWTRPFEGTGRP